MMKTLLHSASVFVFAGLSLGQSAVAQDGEPIAIYTATSDGAPATRGPDGAALPACSGAFSDEDAHIYDGDQVQTPAGTSVVFSLPDVSATVLMQGASELSFKRLPVVDNGNAVVLTLLAGRAYVTANATSDHLLVMAGETAGGSGYTVSSGASVSMGADPTGVTFAVLSGEASFFLGNVPEQVSQQGGESVSGGQHRTTQADAGPAEGIPEALSASAGQRGMTTALYQCGLHAGDSLVEKAERGDLTPVRLAAAPQPSVWPPSEGDIELAFTQPRAAVVASATPVTTTPVRIQVGSPVRNLLLSTRPGSVIIGQRLARTRIIGSPGTRGGAIRVNPNAEQLIRLPGGRR